MNTPAPIKHLLLLLAATSLVACSTMRATDAGFLTDRHAMTFSGDGSTGHYRSQIAIDPRQIQSSSVQWATSETAGFSGQEKDQLVATLRDELSSQFRDLPAVTNGRAVILRAAVTRVEAVSPALNTVSTILLFAPMDRGGAAVEIEMLDAHTGRPLASYATAYYAPMSEFKARFSRLAPAEFVLKKAAAEFVQLARSGV